VNCTYCSDTVPLLYQYISECSTLMGAQGTVWRLISPFSGGNQGNQAAEVMPCQRMPTAEFITEPLQLCHSTTKFDSHCLLLQ
jgi:hypothetical protein